MPKKVMTQEKLNTLRELQLKGLSASAIANHMNLNRYTVAEYISGGKRGVITLPKPRTVERVTRENTTWLPNEKKLLADEYSQLPVKYYNHPRFLELCRKLQRSRMAVELMARKLGLKKPANEFQKVFRPDPPKQPLKRPPTAYNNIPTPYGIATEMHAGNRIFI